MAASCRAKTEEDWVVIVRGKVSPAAGCCGDDKAAPNAGAAVDFSG